MASWAKDIPVVSFETFLAGEQQARRRHELVGGRVYVMAGGTERHDLAAGLLYVALAPKALARGCRPFIANRLVRLGDAAYYPDVFVVCGPAADQFYERDLTVVIEVLAPSTIDMGRREKAVAYAGAPSFQRYLLVDPQRRWIEVAEPSADGLRWQAYGPGSVVPTPFGSVDLDELYDALDASAST
jgi:Uma2 family endonuclease